MDGGHDSTKRLAADHAVSRRWLALASLLLLLPAVFVQWSSVSRPSSDVHVSGWFQGDMPTYVCYARMGEPATLGFTYRNAHDIRDDGSARLVNLPITLMGWMLHLGVGPVVLEHVLRILFGWTMFFVLGLLLRVLFPRRLWFWLAWIATALGGGFTWWAALGDLPPGTHDVVSWVLMRTRMLQQSHYWWFLDLYRNTWYPLELIYHTLVFGQLYGLSTRRWKLAAAFHALGCLSNPFVGIQMTAVQFLAVGVASRRTAPPAWRLITFSAVVGVVFVAYYGWFLPLDDAVRSLEDQHRFSYQQNLEWWVVKTEYGPALLGLVGLVVDPGFRRSLRENWVFVPITLLTIVTALLSQNGRFGLTLMPLHFTRGYLHTGLWILTIAWALRLATLSIHRSVGVGRFVAAFTVSLVLLTLPGTFAFLRWEQNAGPNSPSLVWPNDYQEVLVALEREEETRRVVVHDWALSRQVCGLTWHRAAFGTELTTPHYGRRVDELNTFARSGDESPLIQWADVMIVSPAERQLRLRLDGSEGWELWLENSSWAMFRRRE